MQTKKPTTIVFLGVILLILLFSSNKYQGLVINNKSSQTQDLQPTETPIPTVTNTPTQTPTNTPTPKPTNPAYPTPTKIIATTSNNELDILFEKYSNQYAVDKNILVYIAACESRLSPGAVNGDYGGLFQFSPSTWQSTRKAMNLDINPSLRFNSEEAIKTAAFKISIGGKNSWKNCLPK